MIKRIFWIGVNSFVELSKDKAVGGFLLVGVLFITAGRVLADLSVVEQHKIILETGMGSIFLVGFFITLFAGTNILDREIRERQVFCTLSKPVPRWAWMLGKTFGLAALLFLFVFSLTAFLYFFSGSQTGIWNKSLFAGGFFLYLMFLVLGSYTVLFSTITSQFMALFYGLLVMLIGYSVDDLRVYWNSSNEGAKFLSKALYYILPDLQTFSPYPVVMGRESVPLELLATMLLYALAYTVIPIAVGMLVLERREFE